MTAEALFRLNDSVEARLNAHLSKSIINIERILNIAFPRVERSGGDFFFFDTEELRQWGK